MNIESEHVSETGENSLTGAEIAVIGMAGRFPGAKNLEEFWNNLINGVESITFFTDEQLKDAGVDPRLIENPGFVKCGGGMLEGKEYFDASFFGFKPVEAELTDPQLRIFLECVWEALEDGGYASDLLHKRIIGHYAGATDNFHWNALTLLSGKRQMLGEFAASLFTMKDQLSTRISYTFNLKGPGVTVQTACSTSLVAIHMACQAILNGECDMALAGGVTVKALTEYGYIYQEGMINSSDGHCRAFDARAGGTISGEGAGVVLLKSLEDARADRDHIHAVIKGSSVNNDGNRKVGYTAPSVIGQAEAIRVAHQVAEIDADTVGYLETHGTGTNVGDPIEIEALNMAFNTGKRGFCAIGSVKTNIGHLDSAAGVASFIKTVLTLRQRRIPPSLNYQRPNPKIDFENSPFYVVTEAKEWESNGCPLRAGVSSFGIGGTNAHVVLEEAPVVSGSGDSWNRKYQLILLSAKTETALQKMTENLTDHLKRNPGINLADTAYTLQVGRKNFRHRRFLVSSNDVNEAAETFSGNTKKVKTHFVKEEESPVVFMFAGQGSQYVNMGLDLYRTEKGFRGVVDRCFDILNPIMGIDLKEILYPEQSAASPDRIHQTAVTQPIVFVFEYALAVLLMKWGIKPHSMIGYSLGEYVAACVSGVISLEDALELVALRGQLMQQVPEGAMLSVPLPEDQIEPLLDENLSLAIVNNPSCIVAGSVEAVDRFEKELKEKRLLPIRINAYHAAHSLLMDSVIDEFLEKINTVKLNPPGIPYISNLTGSWITPDQAVDPQYWGRQLRGTVRFSDGLNELLKQENAVFVEFGPGRVLGTFVRQHPAKQPEHKIMNMVRHPQEKIPDDYLLLSKVGQLWLYGAVVDWDGFYGEEKRHRLPLPTYPFERHRFWIDIGNEPFAMGADMMSLVTGMGKKQDVSQWFYAPSWKRSPLPYRNVFSSAVPPVCLVFTDQCGIGSMLAKRLEQEGAQVIEVRQGTSFARSTDESREVYTLNPDQSKDFDTLLSELYARGRVPGTVVHLWNVTGNESPELTIENVDRMLTLGFYSLIYLAQAVGRQNINDELRFVVVSDNMQDVTGVETLQPQKSLLLAPVRIIPGEYPNIRCRSIDIDLADEKERFIHFLAVEIITQSPDEIIAYRNNHRWVHRFEPFRLEPLSPVKATAGTEAPRLREQGVYLVVGGLGGIGMELAGELARQVRARLVLTGRTELPPKGRWQQWLADHKDDPDDKVSIKIKKIRDLENLGAGVLAVTADVADYQRMKEIVLQAEKEFGPIDGVIHCAGDVDRGGVIQRRSKETLEHVLAAKVKGTLVLDSVLKDTTLDFFILCSSLASILAPFGEVGYTAANLFLDAFARSGISRNSGFTASINWDMWQDVGISVEAAKKMNVTLADGISSAEGRDAFLRILHDRQPQVAVSAGDLNLKIKIGQSLAGAAANPYDHERSGDVSRAPVLYRRPELSSEYVTPENEFEKICAGVFQEFLGLDRVGTEDNFFELGASSLDIIHINSKLKELTGKEISPVIMFEYPTVASLAAFFGEAADEHIDRSGKIDKGKDKLKLIKKKAKRA